MLWMESAISATDPEMATMATWMRAVTASTSRLILTARIPAALDSSASSMLSAVSWLWGSSTSRTAPRSPWE